MSMKIHKIINSINNITKNDKTINKVADTAKNIVQEIKNQSVPKWKKMLSVVLMLGTLLYNFIPIDLLPAIPLDNLLATGAATFNLIQQNTENQQALIVKISKYLKWIFVLLLIFIVLVFGTLIALLVNLMQA